MFNAALHLFKRFSKVFTGEISISGYHFILNIILMRHLSVRDYGIFALVFLTAGLVQAYSGGLTGTPLSVNIPKQTSIKSGLRLEVIFGSISLLFSSLIFIMTFVLTYIFTLNVILSLFSALSLALWGLRAGLRGMFFARKKTDEALYGDMIYVFSGIAVLAVLYIIDVVISLEYALLAVIVPQIFSISGGVWLKKEKIRFSFSKKHLTVYRQLSLSPALWDSLTISVSFLQSHIQSLAVASLFGPAIYAPLAAGLVLFAPFRTATLAIGNTIRPDFARGFAKNDKNAIYSHLKSGLFLMIGATLIFLLILWALWPYLYNFLYKAQFSGQSMGLIIFLNGLAALAYTNGNVFQFMLQAGGSNRDIAISRIIGTIASFVVLAVVLKFFDIPYVIVALIAAESVSLFYLIKASLRLFKNRFGDIS